MLLLLLFVVKGGAQGIQFSSAGWGEAMQKAGTEQKMLFVDFYTTWCGPCKMMSNDIFTQEAAGEFFNSNFVNCKIDAEKGEGPALARQYGVTSYPTCVFIAPDGQLVCKFVGTRAVDKLIGEGEKALELFALLPKLAQYEKDYNSGRREKEFLADYYGIVKMAGNGGGAVLNDYLMSLSDGELFVEGRGTDFANISLLDAALFNRILGYMEAMDEGQKELHSHYTANVMRGLSTCFRNCISENNEGDLELLLGMKKRVGTLDSELIATMLGGIAYLPPDRLRMNFYSANQQNDKYKQAFERYVRAIQDETDVEAMQNQRNLTAENGGNDDTATRDEKMSKFMIDTQNKIYSTSIVQGASTYWNMSDSTDAVVKERCIGWFEYAYRVDPSPFLATLCADFLESVNEHEKAQSILADALDKAEKGQSGEVEEEQIIKLKERLGKV